MKIFEKSPNFVLRILLSRIIFTRVGVVRVGLIIHSFIHSFNDAKKNKQFDDITLYIFLELNFFALPNFPFILIFFSQSIVVQDVLHTHIRTNRKKRRPMQVKGQRNELIKFSVVRIRSLLPSIPTLFITGTCHEMGHELIIIWWRYSVYVHQSWFSERKSLSLMVIATLPCIIPKGRKRKIQLVLLFAELISAFRRAHKRQNGQGDSGNSTEIKSSVQGQLKIVRHASTEHLEVP